MIYPALQKPLLKRGVPPLVAALDWVLVGVTLLTFDVMMILTTLVYFALVRQWVAIFYEKDPYYTSVLVAQLRYRPFYSGGSGRGANAKGGA